MDISKENKLSELIMLHLQGGNSPQELQQLKQILNDDIEAVELYVEYMMQFSALNQPGKIIIKDFPEESSSPMLDTSLWMALSKYETEAPEIEIPKEKPRRELVQEVVYPLREKRKQSTFSKIILVMNAAAILFFALFLTFAPPKGGIEVATLMDSLNAKWADLALSQGVRLKSDGKPLMLREGMAELIFDNNTKIVIEAPAEFELVSKEQIYLRYGRLYATVPVEGVGFSVNTSSSRIIDLGTEFGVDADAHGDTFLHVIKGKTVLIAGEKSNKKTVAVAGGDAKKVSAQSQKISDIPCNDRLFVREIDSSRNLVWRGQTELSLADIVGGGNGFGKIRSLIGLDPGTGQYSPIDWQRRSAEHNYSLVPDSEFIDGVFVPDGGSEGSIIISSAKDTFQCPDTIGEYTYGITVYAGDIEKLHDSIPLVSIPQAVFDGHPYLNDEIMMIHSNAGITFDLEAIRQSLPGLALTHFKAFGGITESLRNTKTGLPEADFWLVVDGQIRYEKKALTIEDGRVSFDVELSRGDRFLTLIVADGYRITEAPDDRAPWNNDYFYLVDPKLYIESASD